MFKPIDLVAKQHNPSADMTILYRALRFSESLVPNKTPVFWLIRKDLARYNNLFIVTWLYICGNLFDVYVTYLRFKKIKLSLHWLSKNVIHEMYPLDNKLAPGAKTFHFVFKLAYGKDLAVSVWNSEAKFSLYRYPYRSFTVTTLLRLEVYINTIFPTGWLSLFALDLLV